jgi:hypothetical protein
MIAGFAGWLTVSQYLNFHDLRDRANESYCGVMRLILYGVRYALEPREYTYDVAVIYVRYAGLRWRDEKDGVRPLRIAAICAGFILEASLEAPPVLGIRSTYNIGCGWCRIHYKWRDNSLSARNVSTTLFC